MTALTRSAANAPMLRALGATPAVADALDADALRRVVVAARPTHVIHQLTALPKGGPKSARDLAPTNRLRIDGTRNLIAAAIAAGATRLVGGSFAPARRRRRPACPAGCAGGGRRRALDGVADPRGERARRIEGVVLRYGLFYGPENGDRRMQMIALARRRLLPAVRGDRGLLPCIHVDDAASATVAALERGARRQHLRHRRRSSRSA